MRFEQALQAMREGKKVKSSTTVYPLYLGNYTNDFGETYKAICLKDSIDNAQEYLIDHNQVLAEDWEIVEDAD